MGIMESLMPSKSSQKDDDYIELTDEHLDEGSETSDFVVKFGKLRGERDKMAIKDAVFDGNIVIVDYSSAELKGVNMDTVRSELRETVSEVEGDIVETDSEHFIITPSEVSISRDRLE